MMGPKVTDDGDNHQASYLLSKTFYAYCPPYSHSGLWRQKYTFPLK